MKRRIALHLLLAASLCPRFDAAAQDAETALARAQSAYNGFQTLAADFRQTIVNRMLGAPDSSNGTLFLRKPNRFAMRFADPAGDRLVADGTWLWVYTPEMVPDQVIRQPIPTGGAITPNLFAQFVDRATERYSMTYRGEEDVRGMLADIVRLVPVEEGAFRSATVWIARNSGLMVRVDIREDSGQTRTLDLIDIRPREDIPDAEFEFDVPAGTRVVEP